MLGRSLKSCDSSDGQILIFVPDKPLCWQSLCRLEIGGHWPTGWRSAGESGCVVAL